MNSSGLNAAKDMLERIIIDVEHAEGSITLGNVLWRVAEGFELEFKDT
jgi:hypothetical protein